MSSNDIPQKLRYWVGTAPTPRATIYVVLAALCPWISLVVKVYRSFVTSVTTSQWGAAGGENVSPHIQYMARAGELSESSCLTGSAVHNPAARSSSQRAGRS